MDQMTEQNRKEILKDIRDGYIDVWDNLTINELFETIEKEHEEIQQYKAIGTVEDFQALKDKQKSFKPVHVSYVINSNGRKKHTMYCRNCGKFSVRVYEKDKFCRECGCAIDWERGKEDEYTRK